MADKSTTLVPSNDAYPLAIMDPERRIRLDALSDELDGVSVGMSMFTCVKMPSGGGRTWEIENPDDADKPETPQTIEGVIIHSQRVNAYWSKPFEETGGSAPDCSSSDGVTGCGDRSAAGVDDGGQQCRPCGEAHKAGCCPLNEFGSDPKGGKACRNSWLLFVLRPDEAIPLLVALPPSSLSAYTDFITAQFVKKGRTRGTYAVSIGLTKDKSADGIEYSKATFAFVAPLSPEQAQVTSMMRSDLAAFVGDNAAALLTESVSGIDAEAPY